MVATLATQGIVALSGMPTVPYFDPAELTLNADIHKYWWHYTAPGYTKKETTLPSDDAAIGDNVGMFLGMPGAAGVGGTATVGLAKGSVTPCVVAEDGVDVPSGIFYEVGVRSAVVSSTGFTYGYRTKRLTEGNSGGLMLFNGLDASPRAMYLTQYGDVIEFGSEWIFGHTTAYDMDPDVSGFEQYHSVVAVFSPGVTPGTLTLALYVNRVLAASATEYTPSFYDTLNTDRFYSAQTGKTWRLQSRLLLGQDITDPVDIDNLFNFLEFGVG